jgi:hypothetical protein
MANSVSILINAVDNASGVIKKVSGEMGGMGVSMLKTIATSAALATAVSKIGEAIKDSIDTTVKYNEQVYKLSIVSGQSMENTSRLVQVFDDLGISVDSLTPAIRAMTKNGLSPSIEAIAKLSDQYVALAPGQERAEFLMKNFGRAGLEMADVMSKGGAAIKQLSAAVSDNLLATDESRKKMKEYTQAIDEWEEAILGAKMVVAESVVPALTAVMNQVVDGARAQELWTEAGYKGSVGNTALATTYLKLATAERESNLALITGKGIITTLDKGERDNVKTVEDLTDATKDWAEANKELQDSNRQTIDGILGLTSANQELVSAQTEIQNQQAEIMAEKAALYPWETKKIEDLQDKYDELGNKYEENAAKHKAATEKILLDMTLEAIAMSDGIAGYSEAEAEKAIAVASAAGAAEEAAIREQIAMEAIAQAIADGPIQKGMDLRKILEEMTAHGWTVELAIAMSGMQSDWSGTGGVTPGVTHATGGSFIIPSSYGNEGFGMGGIATASAGELVTITPRTQSGGDNSQTVTLLQQIANKPGLDEARLARLLRDVLLQVAG